MDQNPTIFALSSGHGKAGIAVVRISGPQAEHVLGAVAGRAPPPRRATLARLADPATGEALDEALILWFPAPESFTGEPMAELHIHGGRGVIGAVLGALASIPGLRLAEPGEFARRAFANGKLDLTAAEGLADLIDAETAAQRRQALRQSGGALSELYDGWRTELVGALALVEAAIDFSDEADVAADAVAKARAAALGIGQAIRQHLDDGRRGEIVRDGFRVVIAGPPNVGKSSLLNALARREAAIVSEEAGTTRDVIEVWLDLDGLAVVVADTAGLRATDSRIERAGISRTVARARAADLVLWIMDALSPDPRLPGELAGTATVMRVLNKVDLLDARAVAQVDPAWFRLSATTGAGLDGLAAQIADQARFRIGDSEAPALTQARHRQQLEACVAGLAAFADGGDDNLELRAEDLRQAANALGRITGRVDPEDVLDQIFARFCVGK